MTESLKKLKLCPFCGGYHIWLQHGVNELDWWVACDDCNARGSWSFGKSGASEAWNTRPVEAQLLEACKFAMDNIGYLQNLWGKEGVTDGIYQRMKAAIHAAEGGE